MADWLSWLHLPQLSDSEYLRKKAAYIAENGYTLTIPGLSDIIKIPTSEPMTGLEHNLWTSGQKDKFSPERRSELEKQMAKRRGRFEAMLSAPTPVGFQNIGSVMTSIDDAQDAISTLGVLGRIARRIAPKAIGRLLTGPVGLLVTAADILNLVQAIPQTCLNPRASKGLGEKISRASPATKKGRKTLSKKLKVTMPNKGDVIQALQTSEQIFGFGVSLGPLVGLAQDIYFGAALNLQGIPVKTKLPIPDFGHWFQVAQRVAKASALTFGTYHGTDDDEMLSIIATTELAFQHLATCNETWNPLDNVEDPGNVQVKAPTPWHSQTLEVLRDNNIDPSQSVGWPQTGSAWSTVNNIADATQDIATDNLQRFVTRNKNSWRGFMGGSAIAEGSLFAISAIDGPEGIEEDWHIGSKICATLMKYSYRLDPNQPIENFEAFASYMQYQEETQDNPTLQEIISFCDGPAGISLVRT